MSVESQRAFLEKLHAELSINSSDYRADTANQQLHNFTVTRRAIRRGIKDILKLNFDGIKQTEIDMVLKKINPRIFKAIKDIGSNIRKTAARDSTVTLTKFTSSTINSTFAVKAGKNRYAKAYAMYKNEMVQLASELSAVVSSHLKQDAEFQSGKVWNLEHNFLEGVVESQVRDAIDNAVKEESDITARQASAFFKKRGVDLRVVRNSKTSTMNVFIGSTTANIQEGGESKARKAKLLKVLKHSIKKLDKQRPLAGLPGSDSFDTIKRKRILAKTLDPFKKLKNVKVVSDNTKIKHGTTDVKLKKTSKTLVSGALISKKAIKRRSSKGVSSSPLMLLALINKQLPQVVQKNMESPGLENRTGRFASSVRATDIVKTPKGYPSIGYTYQKFPYQTFEPGYAQGSVERDPRSLIDKSIREIAVQFAIGRFYTRRV